MRKIFPHHERNNEIPGRAKAASSGLFPRFVTLYLDSSSMCLAKYPPMLCSKRHIPLKPPPDLSPFTD